MTHPCHIEEESLLAYILGDAPQDIKDQIAGSAGCQAAARQLAAELRPFQEVLYRLRCPDEETLVAYAERELQSTHQLVVHAHVQRCLLCQEEQRLIAEMSAIPLAPQQEGLLQRLKPIIEALYRPPLQAQRRGEGEGMLHYTTPQLSISIRPRQVEGKERTWTIRGQVRTPDHKQAKGVVEAVIMRDLGQAAGEEIQGAVEQTGAFVFRALAPGIYTLRIITADEEIVIRKLAIGLEE